MLADEIKKIIEETLKNLNVVFEEIEVVESEHPKFVIRTPESGPLIGSRGENLQALNHLIRRMAAQKAGEEIKVFVDVNDYQEANIKKILDKAKIIAERAKSFKSQVELEPMSPYERMVVHSHLAEDPHIKTESIGFGKDRRVIIKYFEAEGEF